MLTLNLRRLILAGLLVQTSHAQQTNSLIQRAINATGINKAKGRLLHFDAAGGQKPIPYSELSATEKSYQRALCVRPANSIIQIQRQANSPQVSADDRCHFG
jgi:hypothetical protein